MPAEITLGGTTIPVLAQRHAYLARALGPALQGALARGEDISAETFLTAAGEGVYDLLTALMPNLSARLPRWQFLGFASADAYAADDYDPDLDTSPSLPEIRDAFNVALDVNGLKALGELLGKVVDPRLLRAQLNATIVDAISSTASQSLPPTSGESPPTTSTTTVPVSTVSGDLPSSDSPA